MAVGGGKTGNLEPIQSQVMSEGWSDYVACTLIGSKVIGAWATCNPQGMRAFPYNEGFPHTFDHLRQWQNESRESNLP